MNSDIQQKKIKIVNIYILNRYIKLSNLIRKLNIHTLWNITIFIAKLSIIKDRKIQIISKFVK